MHHVHISTPALIISVFFVLGVLTLLFAYLSDRRRDRIEAEWIRRMAADKETYRTAFGGQRSFSPAQNTAAQNVGMGYVAPVVAAPVYGATAADVMLAGAVGVIAGEAIAGAFCEPGYIEPVAFPDSFDPSFDVGGCVMESGGVDIDF